MLSGQVAAGGWPDRRLAGRWCGGTGIDPIIGSRNRSPLRKARAALPRLDRACGRLQPRRPMLRDREQPGDSLRRRAPTLGREHGPAAGSRRCRTPTGSRHWPSSPTARSLAAGDYDGLVRFWDTSTGREIGRPLPQGEMVLSLAYSPDGTMLAVGLASEKGKAGTRLWDTRTRQPIGELLPSTDMSPGSNSGRMVEPCSRVARQRSLNPPVGHDARAGARRADDRRGRRRIPSRRSCIPHAG